METINVTEFKNNISKFISYVERGEVVAIYKRNTPIAFLVPYISKPSGNRTKLGCGLGTVQIKVDMTEPLIPGFGIPKKNSD